VTEIILAFLGNSFHHSQMKGLKYVANIKLNMFNKIVFKTRNTQISDISWFNLAVTVVYYL
jgi:hypothetical protein